LVRGSRFAAVPRALPVLRGAYCLQ